MQRRTSCPEATQAVGGERKTKLAQSNPCSGGQYIIRSNKHFRLQRLFFSSAPVLPRQPKAAIRQYVNDCTWLPSRTVAVTAGCMQLPGWVCQSLPLASSHNGSVGHASQDAPVTSLSSPR